MKKILLFTMLILNITYAISQTVGKCIKGNCEKGNGTLETSDGNQYKGHWENGKINGKGTVTYANGDKYSGELLDGKHSGKGTYFWANGNKYKGDWKNDLFEGQGEMVYSNGTKTVGEWRGGKIVTRLANGDVYIGDWKDGKFNGYGTLETHYFITKTYVGEFKNGERNGHGTQTWKGVKYEGEWKNDMYDGQGTLTDENGYSYTGGWVHGLQHGFGVLRYPNGDVYTGNFAMGGRDGLGKLVTKNGEIKDGYWQQNVWFEQAVRLGFNKPVDMSLGSIIDAVAEVHSWGQGNSESKVSEPTRNTSLKRTIKDISKISPIKYNVIFTDGSKLDVNFTFKNNLTYFNEYMVSWVKPGTDIEKKVSVYYCFISSGSFGLGATKNNWYSCSDKEFSSCYICEKKEEDADIKTIIKLYVNRY